MVRSHSAARVAQGASRSFRPTTFDKLTVRFVLFLHQAEKFIICLEIDPVKIVEAMAKDRFAILSIRPATRQGRSNYRSGYLSTVLKATRMPSGEMAGKIPSAIFRSPVPSRLAT
jgi:hypothetical protein